MFHAPSSSGETVMGATMSGVRIAAASSAARFDGAGVTAVLAAAMLRWARSARTSCGTVAVSRVCAPRAMALHVTP